jgi:hypothetical protein
MRSVVFGTLTCGTIWNVLRGLYKCWMGQAGKDMSDLYDKIKEDAVFCRTWQICVDLGSSCHQLDRVYRKLWAEAEAAKAG